ncbi:MAG: glycosyltransferase family 39 protein, partial [Candidatus Omnitrophica bacterium]|nr:glycosyltransferase family 39 protein [Candidatus Omnitrophota bacterium]
MNKLIKLSGRNLILILLFISSCIIFSAYNKYWAPCDEGIITVAAERVLHNEVPYRDFFIVMYPPGQIFILAFLYKIFGISLEVGRIYTSFVQVFIALLSFLMCKMLTGKRNISMLAWFIVLTCLAPRLGSIPAPIWPGMAFALFSIYLFMKYIQLEKLPYVIYSGIAAGLAIIFRHDIGLFVFISIFISLLIYRRAVKNILIFTLSAFILPLSFLPYFISKGAISGLCKSLFLFPFIHEKTANLYFPKPCLNLNMIFHQSLYFIKINQYYIPLLIYAFIFIFLLSRLVKNRRFIKIDIMLFAILVFGALTFNQVRIRTDPAHLLTVIYPSVFLFGFMLYKAIYTQNIPKVLRYTYTSYAFLIFFLFSLLVVKNIDKYFKNVFRKPYKKSIVLTRFNRGSVYIPKEEQKHVKDTVSFIKRNTDINERIYIGNIAHWKDDFGGSLILYTLCEGLPSTKYYEILPGLITQKKVQEEIKESLLRKDVNFIILQDIALPKKPKIVNNRMILDNHIKAHFK